MVICTNLKCGSNTEKEIVNERLYKQRNISSLFLLMFGFHICAGVPSRLAYSRAGQGSTASAKFDIERLLKSQLTS